MLCLRIMFSFPSARLLLGTRFGCLQNEISLYVYVRRYYLDRNNVVSSGHETGSVGVFTFSYAENIAESTVKHTCLHSFRLPQLLFCFIKR